MLATINIKNYKDTDSKDRLETSVDGVSVTDEIITDRVNRITIAKSSAEQVLKAAYACKGASVQLRPICVNAHKDTIEFSFDGIEGGEWLCPKPVSKHLIENAHGYPLTNITYDEEERFLKDIGLQRMDWRALLYVIVMFLLAYRTRYPYAVLYGEEYGHYDNGIESAYHPIGCTDRIPEEHVFARDDCSKELRFMGIESIFGGLDQRVAADHDESEKQLWNLFLLLTRNGLEMSTIRYGASFDYGSDDGPFCFNCTADWGNADYTIGLRPFLPEGELGDSKGDRPLQR